MNSVIKRLVIAFAALFTVSAANAQNVKYEQISFAEYITSGGGLMGIALGLILLATIGVLIALVFLLMALNKMVAELDKSAVEGKPSFLAQIISDIKERFVTGKHYKGEAEKQTMLLDHEYDGIGELNYGMPPWLQTLFWATVIWGVGYGLNMYVFRGIPMHEEMYEAEFAQVEEMKKVAAASINEDNVQFDEEAAKVSGSAIFQANCKACHGAEGEGGIGPNMTDNFYIHGGDIKSIFKTIKYGVAAKGMISWEAKLNPLEMQAVASYVKTLRGKKVADGVKLKEPQGDPYDGE